jgi:hypothetical protein
VVRDQVLRLADEVHELANSAIAATQLADQLPPQRITEEPENFRRLDGGHRGHYISNN